MGVTVIDVPDRASLSLSADICASQHLDRFSLTGHIWSQSNSLSVPVLASDLLLSNPLLC